MSTTPSRGAAQDWRSISAPFVLRPVGATLMALALMLAGMIAFPFLPVASMPSIEFPTIVVSASRPGADPQTMAKSVAAPLERALGAIAGVNEITSTSSLGSTRIVLQFDLSRKVESAARDVQAALNVAVADLPADLPSFPRIRKFNPASQPVLVLAMTSTTLASGALYDLADSLVAQRIAQVRGVGDVSVSGAEQPAIRVRADPARLAAMGLGVDDLRAAIVAADAFSPVGAFEGADRVQSIGLPRQPVTPDGFRSIIVRRAGAAATRLGDVADVQLGVRDTFAAGWYNGKPAVIINVTKESAANVLETIEGVRAILPELQRFLPKGVKIDVMSDRAGAIRASVRDLEFLLAISITLVTLLVALFLRRLSSTVAAAVTVPLSLAGAFIAMWAADFSLDNLSLMAITIAVGFVIDDAIVMIENIHRNRETGMGRIEAALAGARQIGFTVVSISLSLIAAFIPLIFMPGIVGRIFREFSLTLSFAILVSMAVSLTITPMIAAHLSRDDDRLTPDHEMSGWYAAVLRSYERSLGLALRHPWLVLCVFVGTIAMTAHLYRVTPKGWLPSDDSGRIFGWAEASQDASFEATYALAQRVDAILKADPDVESVASFIGSGGASANSGRYQIALKPMPERKLTTDRVIARLRRQLNTVAGMQVNLYAQRDIRVGGRQGRSQYQFTLWGQDFPALLEAARRMQDTVGKLPQIVDFSDDRDLGGLQADVVIDRIAAARLGVSVKDISNALSNAFSQRQIATLYTQRNQYRVVLEVSPARKREPGDIEGVYVPNSAGAQIPLASVAHVQRGVATLSVNHQSGFPSITFTYDLAEGRTLDEATAAIRQAVAALQLPESVSADFAGDAKAFRENASSQLWLIVGALLAVYIILGVLYESLLHPLTIISTLPPAGLGALVALNLAGMELSLLAFIAIILLIGIVKKNGIIMVDFAIGAEREQGLSPEAAARAACLQRFRPILMTTFAAMLGALPLALGSGPGSELRRPLGVAIVGGLALSQALTLYTTPVIYLLMSRLRRRFGSHGGKIARPSALQRIGLRSSAAPATRP